MTKVVYQPIFRRSFDFSDSEAPHPWIYGPLFTESAEAKRYVRENAERIDPEVEQQQFYWSSTHLIYRPTSGQLRIVGRIETRLLHGPGQFYWIDDNLDQPEEICPWGCDDPGS